MATCAITCTATTSSPGSKRSLKLNLVGLAGPNTVEGSGLAAGAWYRAPAEQRVPLCRRVGIRSEDHRSEDGAEALVEAQVDDEVDGGVGDDESVADAAEVELEAAAQSRRVRQEVPRQLGDERRELTDTEDDDDDNQDERDVVVMTSGRNEFIIIIIVVSFLSLSQKIVMFFFFLFVITIIIVR